MNDTTTFYKVLSGDGSAYHGGTGKWFLPKGKRPGKWMPVIKNIEPCQRGYHLCEGIPDLLEWLGPVIYVAEYRGESIRAENKIVVSEARLLRRVEGWNERTARLFAADCAADVLPIFEQAHPGNAGPRMAIKAARAFANGKISAEELDAAWDAAGAAARAAAGAAAGAAARQRQAKRLALFMNGQ